jgi:predicted outer membrane protein
MGACAAAWGQAPNSPQQQPDRPNSGGAGANPTQEEKDRSGRPGTNNPTQDQKEKDRSGTTNTEGSQDKKASADQQIAFFLWSGAQKEIEISKIAQQQAQDKRVKQFAEKMIEEHSQQVSKLEQFAGQMQRAGTTRTDSTESQPGSNDSPGTNESRASNQRDRAGTSQTEGRDTNKDKPSGTKERPQEGVEPAREGATEQSGTRGTTPSVSGQGLNWLEVHQQLNQRCLASAKKELSSKKGADFDACYMGMQVFGHMEMLDQLQVFSQHASGKLQQDLEQGIAMTQQHLTEARQILEQVKGAGTHGSPNSGVSPAGFNAPDSSQPSENDGSKRPSDTRDK